MIAKPFVTITSRRTRGGFTLVELLVSVVVLVIVIFMVSQLMSSTAAITRTGNKHIDTDTQARVVFDRMALDFAQMLRRTDIDYYVKQRSGYNGHGNGHGWGQGKNADKGSDQMAFFSAVPGYYPSGAGSPISLVAYRVNESTQSWAAGSYGRLERMAKGLHWAGVDDNNATNAPYPIIFAPGQVTAGTGPWGNQQWQAAIKNDNAQSTSFDADYEVIGPGVFRFEYFYLLKNGRVTDWPWDRWEDTINRQKISDSPSIGLSQVESIGVAIAVINPEARALIQAQPLRMRVMATSPISLPTWQTSRTPMGLVMQGKRSEIWKTSGKALWNPLHRPGKPPRID